MTPTSLTDLLAPVPSWVTEWYPNDPHAQRTAIARWYRPVTTAAERAIGFAVRPTAAAHPCVGCGKHRFPAPGAVCFWVPAHDGLPRRIRRSG